MFIFLIFEYFLFNHFSNPQVQLKGVHLNFVPSLLRLFNRGFEETIQLRLLYPLSALLRNSPQAHIQFLEHGGAEVMANLVDAKQTNQKLAVRAMTLMSDLIMEKVEDEGNQGDVHHVSSSGTSHGHQTSSVRQVSGYTLLKRMLMILAFVCFSIDIRQQLLTRDWCARLSSRLQSLDIEAFDHIEKTIHAFVPFASACRPDFSPLLGVFDQFHNIYSQQHLSDESTFGELLDDLQILRSKLRARPSDEL